MSRTLCSKETILHACVPVSAVDVPVACQPVRLAQSSGCERHDARLYRDKGKDTMGTSETDPNAAPSEPSAAIDAEAVQVARDAADTSDEPSGPKKIAVVVAHPDDAEFICAGTIARWVDEGHEVVYVLLTSGDKGSADPEMTPQKLAATREAEQREAARILGARDVIFMRYPDGELEPNLELRREIVRIIRRLKPDVVVCQDPTVRWVDTQYINHPDHRAAGEATLAAVFPAARDRMNFPELLAEGLRTWRSTSPHTWSASWNPCAPTSPRSATGTPSPWSASGQRRPQSGIPAAAIMSRASSISSSTDLVRYYAIMADFTLTASEGE
jgi:LmbE family N-acetylglucosaminyl deacetylase